MYLRGRAIEDEDIDLSKKGWFNLLVNSWKRFETEEIRNTDIQINISDTKFDLTSIIQVKKFPNRIAAIYLRSVDHRKRMKRIQHLFKDYKEIPVLIVDDSNQAIAHAKKYKFI